MAYLYEACDQISDNYRLSFVLIKPVIKMNILYYSKSVMGYQMNLFI